MLIVVDKTTKKKKFDYGTNSLYPEGVPYKAKKNELVFRLHDTKNKLVKKCFETGLYEVILDENNKLIDIKVLPLPQKTLTKKEINQQVVQKIREKYSINDEFQMQRLGLQDNKNTEYINYLLYVNECIDWGNLQKQNITQEG